MVKKHITHTEEEYNEDGELVSSTEEHLIIETHTFLQEADEEEEDLMFVGKKESDGYEDDTPLIIINNDDGFW